MAAATASCPSTSSTNLVLLCASHVSSEERCVRLEAMLESWRMQRVRSNLYLSISFASQHLRERAIQLLRKVQVQVRPGDLIVVTHPTTFSQFEHYKVLVERVARDDSALGFGVGETWCIFTDDDDISHPTRTAWYAQMLKAAEDQGRLVAGLAYLCEEEQLHSLSMPEQELRDLTHDQVKALWNNQMREVGHDREYFHYCVRLTTLRDFVERLHARLLAHPFADTMFTRYLRTPDFAHRATYRQLACMSPYPLLTHFGQDQANDDYVRASSDPYAELVHAAVSEAAQLAKSPSATAVDKRNAELKWKRLELLKWVTSFASVYRPTEAHRDPAYGDTFCPPWKDFLDQSRFIWNSLSGGKRSPAASADALLFDDELAWKELYDRLIRTDAEFRMWLNAPMWQPIGSAIVEDTVSADTKPTTATSPVTSAPAVSSSATAPTDPTAPAAPAQVAPPRTTTTVCTNCGTPTTLRCAGCRTLSLNDTQSVYYCNRACQMAHWSTHRLVCKRTR